MIKRITPFLALCLVPMSALMADPKVYSPTVTKGELAFEIRGNTVVDNDDAVDGSQRHVFEIEYSPTDWWKTAFFSRLVKPGEGSLEYAATAWENIFQLTDEADQLLSSGVYLEYKVSEISGDPDAFETKLLLEKSVSGFLNTLNITFEKEIGSNHEGGVEFAYAWRTKRDITKHIGLGIEIFGELGKVNDIEPLDEQEHRLGPVFYHEIELGEIELSYNLAWLFGLTNDSPDNTFRWQLEFEF